MLHNPPPCRYGFRGCPSLCLEKGETEWSLSTPEREARVRNLCTTKVALSSPLTISRLEAKVKNVCDAKQRVGSNVRGGRIMDAETMEHYKVVYSVIGEILARRTFPATKVVKMRYGCFFTWAHINGRWCRRHWQWCRVRMQKLWSHWVGIITTRCLSRIDVVDRWKRGNGQDRRGDVSISMLNWRQVAPR